MFDERADGDVPSPQEPERWYRVRLPTHLSHELEYCAKRRRISPEALLSLIDTVILSEHLVGSVLDDGR